jgi:hypothetical protein
LFGPERLVIVLSCCFRRAGEGLTVTRGSQASTEPAEAKMMMSRPCVATRRVLWWNSY